jgi:hypothetical protein
MTLRALLVVAGLILMVIGVNLHIFLFHFGFFQKQELTDILHSIKRIEILAALDISFKVIFEGIDIIFLK